MDMLCITIWLYRSLILLMIMLFITLQCYFNGSNPYKYTILNYWSSIRSTNAQNVNYEFLIWYSNTPAIIFIPWAYPTWGSYILYVIRTSLSIYWNWLFTVNVGHSVWVRGMSFYICYAYLSLGFYFWIPLYSLKFCYL